MKLKPNRRKHSTITISRQSIHPECFFCKSQIRVTSESFKTGFSLLRRNIILDVLFDMLSDKVTEHDEVTFTASSVTIYFKKVYYVILALL